MDFFPPAKNCEEMTWLRDGEFMESKGHPIESPGSRFLPQQVVHLTWTPWASEFFGKTQVCRPKIEAAAKIFLWLWGLAYIILIYIYTMDEFDVPWSSQLVPMVQLSRLVFFTHQVGTGLTQRLFDEVVRPSCNSKQFRLKRNVNFQYQFLFGNMIFNIKLKAFNIFDDLVVFLLPA